MYPTQTGRPELRPMASAHLAQTMTMLGMSAEEIREKVEEELAEAIEETAEEIEKDIESVVEEAEA